MNRYEIHRRPSLVEARAVARTTRISMSRTPKDKSSAWEKIFRGAISSLPDKGSDKGIGLDSLEKNITGKMGSLDSHDPAGLFYLERASKRLNIIKQEKSRRETVRQDPKIIVHGKTGVVAKAKGLATNPEVRTEFFKAHPFATITGAVALGLLGKHWLKKKLTGATHTGQFYGYHPPEIPADIGVMPPTMSNPGYATMGDGAEFYPQHGPLY